MYRAGLQPKTGGPPKWANCRKFNDSINPESVASVKPRG